MSQHLKVPMAANQLITLRAMGLVLQLALTLFGAELFGLSLEPVGLFYVFGLEFGFLALTIWLGHRLVSHKGGLFGSLLLDTLLWIAWLEFSGGATNAFISLLLLPIAIAAVTLPSWAPWCLSALTTAAYSLMLFYSPGDAAMDAHAHMSHAMPHSMPHTMTETSSMASHFIGMWLNFVVSALVLTTTVALIARRLRAADARIAALRESQLRQEQLIALGTASAQMSHQLATPLATLRLLLDEAHEDGGAEPPLVNDMDQALRACESTLSELRTATAAIRERQRQQVSVEALCNSLRQRVLLLMPQVELTSALEPAVAKLLLNTDMSLLPSLLALVDNGARASLEQTGVASVSLAAGLCGVGRLRISIQDQGGGIDERHLKDLGAAPVASEQGLGMALMLTHASLERLGGSLCLANSAGGGCVASVSLPLVTAHPLTDQTVSDEALTGETLTAEAPPGNAASEGKA